MAIQPNGRLHGHEKYVTRIAPIAPASIWGYQVWLNCGHWVHRKVARAKVGSTVLCSECYSGTVQHGPTGPND